MAAVAAANAEKMGLQFAGVVLQTPFIIVAGPKSPHSLWLETMASADEVSHAIGIHEMDTIDEIGTSQAGWCFLGNAAPAFAMLPELVMDADGTNFMINCIPARGLLNALDVDRTGAVKSIHSPLLALGAIHDQVTQSNEDLKELLSHKPGTPATFQAIPGEHFSVYPVVNPSNLAKVAPKFSGNITYDDAAHPAAMNATFQFLDEIFSSRDVFASHSKVLAKANNA